MRAVIALMMILVVAFSLMMVASANGESSAPDAGKVEIIYPVGSGAPGGLLIAPVDPIVLVVPPLPVVPEVEPPALPALPDIPLEPPVDVSVVGGDNGQTVLSDEGAPEIDPLNEDVPLSELPEESASEAELPDEPAPLADVPKTGDLSGLWLAMGTLSGLGLAGASLRKRED